MSLPTPKQTMPVSLNQCVHRQFLDAHRNIDKPEHAKTLNTTTQIDFLLRLASVFSDPGLAHFCLLAEPWGGDCGNRCPIYGWALLRHSAL